MTMPEGYPYEDSVLPSGAPGVTVYDAGYPVAHPVQKGTDSFLAPNVPPNAFTEWTDLDYEIGGETGAVNRNAYVINGIDSYDAHDFRDHVVIPRRTDYGATGDVGSADDYSVQYAQAIAANAYPDVTQQESWDEVSQGF